MDFIDFIFSVTTSRLMPVAWSIVLFIIQTQHGLYQRLFVKHAYMYSYLTWFSIEFVLATLFTIRAITFTAKIVIEVAQFTIRIIT